MSEEARDFFLAGAETILADKGKDICLVYQGVALSINTASLYSKFKHPGDSVPLGVSADGSHASPVQSYTNERLRDLFGCSQGTLCFSVRVASSSTYPLDSLYLYPELFASADRVSLIALPPFFPYGGDSSAVASAEDGLKAFLKGRGLYIATNYQEALPYLEAAREKEPENVLFIERLSSALLKLNRRKEALKLLKHANVLEPRFVKVYWRTCYHLYEQGKFRHSLTTLYNGRAHGIMQEANAKMSAKIRMLGRRCILMIWGASSFNSARAAQLPGDVFQLVLDHLDVHELRRVAQVCFPYMVWATDERYWMRRFGCTREAKRQQVMKNMFEIRIHGLFSMNRRPEHEPPRDNYAFYNSRVCHTWQAVHDHPRFMWRSFVRFLRSTLPRRCSVTVKLRDMPLLVRREDALAEIKTHDTFTPYARVYTLAAALQCLPSGDYFFVAPLAFEYTRYCQVCRFPCGQQERRSRENSQCPTLTHKRSPIPLKWLIKDKKWKHFGIGNRMRQAIEEAYRAVNHTGWNPDIYPCCGSHLPNQCSRTPHRWWRLVSVASKSERHFEEAYPSWSRPEVIVTAYGEYRNPPEVSVFAPTRSESVDGDIAQQPYERMHRKELDSKAGMF